MIRDACSTAGTNEEYSGFGNCAPFLVWAILPFQEILSTELDSPFRTYLDCPESCQREFYRSSHSLAGMAPGLLSPKVDIANGWTLVNSGWSAESCAPQVSDRPASLCSGALRNRFMPAWRLTHSPFWLQMTADALKPGNWPSRVGRDIQPWAALWAIKGADTLSSLEEIEKMIPIGETYRPEPGNVETYERIYQVYNDLHAAMSPLFPRIVPFQKREQLVSSNQDRVVRNSEDFSLLFSPG